MRPPLYSRQLKKDLDTWVAKGWVPEASRALIMAEVGADEARRTLPAILAVLGVVLVGAGAMSFVALNWAEMSKLTKLIVLLGSLVLSYGLAGYLLARGWDAIAQAALLLGVVFFGVNIMLIGQIYNINSGWSDGILMWGAGAMLAAYIVPSRTSLVAAILIGNIWTGYVASETHITAPHWPFMLYLGAAAAFAYYKHWRGEMHLVFLSLIFWAGVNYDAVETLLGWSSAETISLYAAVAFSFWVAGRLLEKSDYAFNTEFERYGLVFAGLLLFLLQWTDEGMTKAVSSGWVIFAVIASVAIVGGSLLARARGTMSNLDVTAATAFLVAILIYPAYVFAREAQLETPYVILVGIYIVWAIAHALRVEDRTLANIGFVGFGLWAIYIYTIVFDDLADQATFFLFGGVLLIALAFGLETVRRRVTQGVPS